MKRIFELLKEKMLKYTKTTALLSGAVLSLPYNFEKLYIFAYIGLAVFAFVLIKDGAAYRPFKTTFAFVMGFNLSVYYWFIELYPFASYDFSPFQGISLVILAWLGISALNAFEMAVVMMFLGKIKTKRVFIPFLASALWVIGEAVVGSGTFGLPWARLAISQIGALPIVQTASVFGSYFISLIVTMISFCLGYWLKNKAEHGKKLSFLPITAVLLFTVNYTAGVVLLYTPPKAEQPLIVAMIQGNVDSSIKWDKDSFDDIVNRHAELTEKAAKEGNADIIIMPETAIPSYFEPEKEIYKPYYEIAKKYDVSIIFGTLAKNDEIYYNSVYCILPNGTVTGGYDKRHLIPFAEWLPYNEELKYTEWLTSVLPFLDGVDLVSSVYRNGTGPGIIVLPDGTKIAPLICYDSAFASLALEAAADGAEIIAIATNDSWYKDSKALYQHVSHAKLRAIETGKYTVSAANTGISFAVTPKGEEICSTEPLIEDVLICEISPVKSTTPYVAIGDFPLYISLAFVICCVMVKVIREN